MTSKAEGPFIKEVGNLEGGRKGVRGQNSLVIILLMDKSKKVPTWCRGVSKYLNKVPTSFMDGPDLV